MGFRIGNKYTSAIVYERLRIKDMLFAEIVLKR